jgi:peptide/nickel transport system substrate-binding protein
LLVFSTKRIVLVLCAVAVALAAGTVATAAERDSVVFTVGLPNDYDTLNPVVGVEVPDYEVWNLQFATLTDKAADDFATIPGLAESWEASNDGKTYTYTLRDGLEWSDGTPLTAEDVAYTVNRAKEEEWLNYDATVQNLTAKVIDETTVELASSVSDPKLPTMDVYILPKHVVEKYDAKAITKWDGITSVGSGPFTLKEAKRGQFWSLTANPSYWGWQGDQPQVDEVIFRLFSGRSTRHTTSRPSRSRVSPEPTGSSRSRASRAASPRSRSTADVPPTGASTGSATATRRSPTSSSARRSPTRWTSRR